MTRKQMNNAFSAGTIAGKKSYDLLLNNCNTLVTESLKAAFEIGNGYFGITPINNHNRDKFSYKEYYSHSLYFKLKK